MLNMIVAMLKKALPHLISGPALIIVFYWLMQVFPTSPALKNIIDAAITIFIVIYLALTLLGKYFEVTDEHQIQQSINKQILLGNAQPPIFVDADPSPRPRLIGHNSFSNISSYAPSHSYGQSPKRFLTFARIFIGMIIIICVLGATLMHFHLVSFTISLPNSPISAPSPSVGTTNSWSNWQIIPNKCSVSGIDYRVSNSNGQDLNACYSPKNRFKNFTYGVTMTIMKGHCGGLLFRKTTRANKYYVFQVCQDKTYALLKYVDNAGKIFQPLFGVSKDNGKIFPGLGVKNTITVTAKGSSFDLSVNNKSIATLKDTSYSEGTIGLVASSDLYGDKTSIVYENVKINIL